MIIGVLKELSPETRVSILPEHVVMLKKWNVTVLVETHPTNRNEIESFFRRLDFREDESYLSVEGHSNYRREAKGNGERTKVYVCPMV